jgi:hypothetical protein
MNELLRITPMSILHIGQKRKCEFNRAETVMSVVGATKWHTEYVNKYGAAPPQDDLILGLYSSAFTKETSRRLGVQFYFSVTEDFEYLKLILGLQEGNWIANGVWTTIGSMLPFRGDQGFVLLPHYRSTGYQNHPSPSNWQISLAGSLKITQVGILSSSSNSYMAKLPDRILVPGLVITSSEEVDLHEWIKEFRIGPTQ